MPLGYLKKLLPKQLLVPLYHTVGNTPKAHLHQLYTTRSQKTFEHDLDYFLKIANPISADDMLKVIEGEIILKKPAFHITFDDGLMEAYTDAAPVLRAKGVPATFFINSGFIENKTLFYRHKAALMARHTHLNPPTRTTLESANLILHKHMVPSAPTLSERVLKINSQQKAAIDELAPMLNIDFEAYTAEVRPYMGLSQIRKLIDWGFNIGAHTATHPNLILLPAQQQLNEVQQSMQWLQQTQPNGPLFFAFPFTDKGFKVDFFEKIETITPRPQLTFGTAGCKPDEIPTHFQRLPMEANNFQAKKQLKQELTYAWFRKLADENMVIH